MVINELDYVSQLIEFAHDIVTIKINNMNGELNSVDVTTRFNV